MKQVSEVHLDNHQRRGFDSHNFIRSVSAGFWSSRALSTAIELNVFGTISKYEKPLEELSQEIGTTQRGLEVLLRFLQILGLVVKRANGCFALTEAGSMLFDPTSNYYLGHEAQISPDIWHSFESLTSKVLHGSPNKTSAEYFDSFNSEELSGFQETMHAQGAIPAQLLASKINVNHRKCVLDIGCGLGIYSICLLKRNPNLKAILIDHPRVIELTKREFERYGFLDRVTFVAGDFWERISDFTFDVALLSKILHDWNDERCLDLLVKIASSLEGDGILVIHEEIIHNSQSPEWWPVILDLFLFTVLGSGKTRTVHELTDLLKRAGYKVNQTQKIDSYTSLMTATKI